MSADPDVIMGFTLANYTGDGFGGDHGCKPVSFLAEDLNRELVASGRPAMSNEQVKALLDDMVAKDEAVERDGEYAKAPYKVQCVCCWDDPCTCGTGPGGWREVFLQSPRI